MASVQQSKGPSVQHNLVSCMSSNSKKRHACIERNINNSRLNKNYLELRSQILKKLSLPDDTNSKIYLPKIESLDESSTEIFFNQARMIEIQYITALTTYDMIKEEDYSVARIYPGVRGHEDFRIVYNEDYDNDREHEEVIEKLYNLRDEHSTYGANVPRKYTDFPEEEFEISFCHA